VLLAVLLVYVLWPALLLEGLRALGFFGWVYGAEFQARLVAGEVKGLDATRCSFWLGDLALPLNLLSVVGLFFALSGTRPYQLGLTTGRLGRNLLLGVITAVCVVPLVYLVLSLVNWLLQRGTGGAPEEHPITKLIQSHPPPVDLVVSGFAALFAAPIVEEFLVRGIIQPWFRAHRWGGYAGLAGALLLAVSRRWSGLEAGWREHGWQQAWPELLPAALVLVMAPGYLLLRAKAPPAAGAVYVTSLLFAAAHAFSLSHVVPMFFFALALGALRYRTQSLVPCMVTHALFNGVAWVLLLLPQPPAEPEKGKDDTDARARAELVSTSSAVPGSVPPRRTYASARTVPSAGDQTDDVTCPASLPSRHSFAPAGSGSVPSTRSPVRTRLTWPRSRRRTIGSWPR
jgi:membrane protease YdiL (CAAX protease family)